MSHHEDEAASVDPPPPEPAVFEADLADREPPVGILQVVDMLANKQPWQLQITADHLQFVNAADQTAIEVPREELPEKTTVHDALLLKRCLEVRAARKRMFQFTEGDFATLTTWLGPPTQRHLVAALKQRLFWVLPIGILFVLGSLPLSGDPEAGVEALPFDAVAFVLGLCLIANGLISKFVPHRAVFLLDSLWFLLLAGDTIYDMLGGASWFWSILVVLQIWLVVSGVKQYLRFAALVGSDQAASSATVRQ